MADTSPDRAWAPGGQPRLPAAPAVPRWARPYASAGSRAAAVTVALGVAAAGNAAAALLEAADPVLRLRPPNGAALAVLVAFLAAVLGTMGGVVAVPLWTHRCYRNLPALGARGLRWSPLWAAGCWFVPLANCVLPFLVVRDMAVAGEPRRSATFLLTAWWATWLATGLVPLLVNRQPVRAGHLPDAPLGALYYTGHLVAALLLIRLVRRVTRRQDDGGAELPGVAAG
jgi:hypothetical protein